MKRREYLHNGGMWLGAVLEKRHHSFGQDEMGHVVDGKASVVPRLGTGGPLPEKAVAVVNASVVDQHVNRPTCYFLDTIRCLPHGNKSRGVPP